MALKGIVGYQDLLGNGDATIIQLALQVIDTSINQAVGSWQFSITHGTDWSYTADSYKSAVTTKAIAAAAGGGYTITAADIVDTTLALAKTYNFAPSRSFVTTAASANGFQLSATRESEVRYGCTIATAATLAAGAVGTIVLEVASTNSSTAGDWKEVSRVTNGQVFSLAVAIGCTQTIASTLSARIPAGYYARLRTINTTGTPTYTFNSGEEVIM